MKKQIEYYVTEKGRCPFIEWFERFPCRYQYFITNYIVRIAEGGSQNNIKSLKDGVFEIRIFKGPGLRVYFGQDGGKILLLLLGGDKSTQKSDIVKAKRYWSDYGKKK